MTDEIERRLWNWVRWRLGGMSDGRFVQYGGGGAGVSSVYRKVRNRRSGYAQASFPVLASEAQATDRAVNALDDPLRVAIHAWYLRRGANGEFFTSDWTQEEIARHVGCARRTFQERLDRARECIRLHCSSELRAVS